MDSRRAVTCAVLVAAILLVVGGIVYSALTIHPQWGYFVSWLAAVAVLAVVGILVLLFYLKRHDATLALALTRKVTKWLESLNTRLLDMNQRLLEPPLSCSYLDSTRIDQMFVRIEPGSDDAVRIGGKRQGPVATMGDSDVGGEPGANAQFDTTASSPERRAREVIKYFLRTGQAAVLQNEERMVADRSLPQLEARVERMVGALEDQVTANLEIDRGNEGTAMAEVKENAERSASSTLSNPPDFVLLMTPLSKVERSGDVSYLGKLTRIKGPPMTVHVLVPPGVVLPVGEPPSVAIPRVFGRVMARPSDLGFALTVEAIAVY